MLFLSLITVLPVIVLFYDGYKKNGLQGGFLNIGYFLLIVLIAIVSLKMYGIYFAFVIPVIFIILVLFKYLNKAKK